MIRSLSELSIAMIIHAKKIWPNEISENIWPYDLKMSIEALNQIPGLQDSIHIIPSKSFQGLK